MKSWSEYWVSFSGQPDSPGYGSEPRSLQERWALPASRERKAGPGFSPIGGQPGHVGGRYIRTCCFSSTNVGVHVPELSGPPCRHYPLLVQAAPPLERGLSGGPRSPRDPDIEGQTTQGRWDEAGKKGPTCVPPGAEWSLTASCWLRSVSGAGDSPS